MSVNLFFDVNRLVLAVLLLGCTAPAFTQGVRISGRIFFPDSTAAGGASIILYDTSNHISSFVNSDKLGIYSIVCNRGRDRWLSVSYIGYTKVTFDLDSLPGKENKEVKLDFFLKEDAKELDEVVVTDPNIERDTIRLNLKNLNLKENTELGDILKKIPSFRVGDDGAIVYNGKNIDKILINKSPAFVNQNSIALKSIESKLIEDIDVINNYQNDFNMDFDQRNETVLNIDTKDKFKNVLLGSIYSGYGYDNKYDVQAKGLYFSKGLNAFAVSNTNNIGNNTIELRDLTNLFSTVQPYSIYQLNALTDLFARDENRLRDFMSANNFTVRDEGKNYRVNAVVYYFNLNRQSSTISDVSTADGTGLLNTENRLSAQGNSLLAKVGSDLRLDKDHIINYEFAGNMLYNEGNMAMDNRILSDSSQYNLLSMERNRINSVFNKITFNNRFSNKFIFNAALYEYNEKSVFPGSNITNMTEGKPVLGQSLNFTKSNVGGEGILKYKFSNAIIPSLRINIDGTKEKLQVDAGNDKQRLDRNTNFYLFSFEVAGNKIFDKLSYDASAGFKDLHTDADTYFSHRWVVPLKLEMIYEDKLNRWNASFTRRIMSSDLETGVPVVKVFNEVVAGSDSLPVNLTTVRELSVGFSHNNLFKGVEYDMEVRYSSWLDQLRKGLTSIDQNGIEYFGTYVIAKSYLWEISGNTSRIFSKVNYPVKVDLGLVYSITNAPSFYLNTLNPISNNESRISLKWETITRHNINFENSSTYTSARLKTGGDSYNSKYFENIAKIKFSAGKIESILSFVYNNNFIINKRYLRKNINLGFTYSFRKLVLGIEGRNVDDIFGLFNNKAYNSTLLYENGINTIVIKNAALNYAILTLKYNFKP